MLAPGGALLVKAQLGVARDGRGRHATPRTLGRHYRAIYPHLDAEVALLRERLRRRRVTVTDPYPPEFSRFDNTHFHHLIARRAA